VIQHPITHLTDNYRKDKDSNNYKLLSLGHKEHIEILKILLLIEAWRDIDNAEGFTLDKIGKNVLELREGRSDEEFRKAIKIKIRGNLSAGTIEDLNVIAEILLGEAFESITETWYQEQYDFEPAALSLLVKNFTARQVEGFETIKVFLDSIKAGGVRLHYYLKWDYASINTIAIGIAQVRVLEISI